MNVVDYTCSTKATVNLHNGTYKDEVSPILYFMDRTHFTALLIKV